MIRPLAAAGVFVGLLVAGLGMLVAAPGIALVLVGFFATDRLSEVWERT